MATLRAALTAISSRGAPDGQQEIFVEGGFLGGANRLPFTSGNQPQPGKSPSGRFKLFLNGEIYSLFDGHGAQRGGTSDTQALVDAIDRFGVPDALKRQDGIFAAIVYDSLAQCIFLARDFFGVKPLYYSIISEGIICASEIKALVKQNQGAEISHVEPGEILCYTNGTIERIDKISLPITTRKTTDSAQFADDVRRSLVRSVETQVADSQNYAVYLSGGLDSSSIYALAKGAGARVTPFVLGSASASDVHAAKVLTAHFGDALNIVDCPTEPELFSALEEIIYCVESFEPNLVRQSSAAKVLAKAVHEAGFRVALCGEGADELFGGYPEFWSGKASFGEVRTALLHDLHRTQLQRVDRVNMAHTIEVRVPFLSAGVAIQALSTDEESSFGIRTADNVNRVKRPLRDAMRCYLPPAVAERPKVVFSEGAGLRGNSPASGMFQDLVRTRIDDVEAAQIRQDFPDWKLRSDEEALYFKIFRSFGFDCYSQARNRVFANSSETV